MLAVPFVSVVVPAFNVADTLSRCVRSVLAQDWPRDALEVLVVDNGSTDGGGELVRDLPLRLISEPRRGRSAARNRGVHESRGDLLAFIDADCEAPANWLSESVAALKRPWIGAVQARVQKHGGAISHAAFSQATYYRPFLDTCALVSTRQAYDDARGFDEELKRNVDMDYSFRLLSCGYAFAFLPACTMIKHHDLTPRQVLRRGWDGGLSVALFAKKWRGMYPHSSRRIWTDRVKAWAHFSWPDLRHPARAKGRLITEASVKLLASVWGDMRGGTVQRSTFEVRAPVPHTIGPARSLVMSGAEALLFDAGARRITRLSPLESCALTARIDGLLGEAQIGAVQSELGVDRAAALRTIERVEALIR